jgi:hypothetical protein
VSAWACWALLAASQALAGPAAATHQPHAEVHALRAGHPPAVDGRLNEESWVLAPPVSGFTQTDPDEGHPATERTEVRVLFDDEAVYIGARLFDSDPRHIVRRLVKRDEQADADRVTVYLDPMHDHLSGAFFQVSASGVQRDSVVFNDSWDDTSWDAVWESAVAVDEQGWSVEMRIPLSQLRFQHADAPVWGINVARYVQRKNETDWLEMSPKSVSGLASRMAHLTGLDGLSLRRHAQFLPYVAGRTELVGAPDSRNPFNDGSRLFGAGGVDMKWGLSSNITLDATINPDFGQVEVDPAVVNLTAFETFFEERRPFFLEGAQTFQNVGRNGANNFWGFNASDPNIFYSRRIGRAPQLTASGDYIDAPTATTILGAAKLTGKTRSGWNIGLLDSLTDSETARMATKGIGGTMEVEPRSNYVVARTQRELGRRAGIGFVLTSVSRHLDTAALATTLPLQATVAGGDAYWFLGPGRDWVINGRLVASRISGDTAAMAHEQKLAQRYYQRPDAPQVSFDPGRTSLSGYTGRVNLNRNSGLWQVNASLWGVSPGFESNDAGFMNQADRAGAHLVVLRRKVTPDRWSRSRSFWAAKWYVWNYGRVLQGDGIQSQASVTFRNYWGANGGGSFRRRVQDDRLTRGGASAVNPAGWSWNLNMNTDARRGLSAQLSSSANANESGGWSRQFGATLTMKPASEFVFVIGPQVNRTLTTAQYIQTVTDATATGTYGRRDVFGVLDQTQVSMTIRANAVVTPHVSLQVYAQPLLASGSYGAFRELARPRTYDFLQYGSASSSIAYDSAARRFTVDPDGSGPAGSFGFDNPDFNLKSLRVNSVFRWEFRPGSTFYAVWTRQQLDNGQPGDFSLGRDARALLSARGDDVFLVKFAYWIAR